MKVISNKKSIEGHMILNIIYKIVNIGITFIYVPILLNYLGNEKYGVWITINSIVSWITYFDIGIGNGLRNRLTENIGKGDLKAQQRTVSTAYICITFITTIILGIAMIAMMIWDIPRIFNLNIASENMKMVIGINIIFVCINFILSLCNTILYALQLSSMVSLISIIPQLINLILIFIVSQNLDSNLIIMSLICGITTAMTNIITSFIIFTKNKNLTPRIRLFEITEMKYINSFGIKMFITQISALILNTTDNLLITKLYGAESVTPYSMIYKVFSYVNIFHMAIIAPMWSSYTLANSKNDINWLKKGLKKTEIILIPFILVTIFIMCMFRSISKVWLGKELNYSSTLIIMTGIYFIILMWTNVYSSFLCGIGKINKFTWACFFQAILNIPLSLIFSLKLNMGLNGVVLGSISVMIITAILTPIEVKKWIKSF